MKNVLEAADNRRINYADVLFANNFPDWFVIRAQQLQWRWIGILLGLRRGGFFYDESIGMVESIIPNRRCSLPADEAVALGEAFIRKLAAYGCSLPESDTLLRSLQLDGFDVDKERLRLVPLEGSVSAQEEEDRLTSLVKSSGLPGTQTILKHIADAQSLYADGKDHPSLNESRSFIQALIDEISIETDKHGKHSTKLPGGTANRMDYLSNVGFMTADEKTAIGSGWGSLSAGSHPGVPQRELARIGLIVALESGQLLILKFANWKANKYQRFS